MEALGKWLLGICGAGIVAAICNALAEGRGKNIVKTAGGLLVALAAAAPLISFGALDPSAQLDAYGADIRARIERQEEMSIDEMRVIVENSCAAYIEEKAAEMGLACAASVTAEVDCEGVMRACDVYVVYSEEALTDEELETVVLMIETDLGVSADMQKHKLRNESSGVN